MSMEGEPSGPPKPEALLSAPQLEPAAEPTEPPLSKQADGDGLGKLRSRRGGGGSDRKPGQPLPALRAVRLEEAVDGAAAVRAATLPAMHAVHAARRTDVTPECTGCSMPPCLLC